MPDEHTERVETGRAGRRAPDCPECGVPMLFRGGQQVHDVWAEHFVCERCGRETYRSYGRGSV